jgi:hypothetical protein
MEIKMINMEKHMQGLMMILKVQFLKEIIG